MKKLIDRHLAIVLFSLSSTLILFNINSCKEDENEQTNQPPQVTIENPADSTNLWEGDSINLTCSATDPEDGELEGEAVIWSSNIDGELGNGILVENVQLSINTHQIIVIAEDKEGLTAYDTVQVTVLDDEQPTVTITHPENNDTIPTGETVTLKCNAVDAEDGNLTGESVQWSSDIDSELGTGDSLAAVSLSAGTHQIEAKATDSRGNTATANIQLTVEENISPEIIINKPFNNYTFVSGQEIKLKCSTTDAEDGTLADDQITWTSDVDGEIGQGSEITAASLSSNNHLLTATAVDNAGAMATDSVAITISSDQLTLDIMVQWMTGTFSSEEQAETSTDPYHYDVRRKTARIWHENTDGYWLYLEQAYAEEQSNPYFQRIYHFYVENDTIKNTIYALPNPDSYAGSWETPDDFDALTVNDLEVRPDCGLTFEINPDHIYGQTSGTDCSSSIPGVSYMSSEQWIYATEWHSWDLGYNDDGEIVMGPYSPYIFDKTEDF